MQSGKTSRYFKYAIGEIILVVIGILIALQINNWNEKRKDVEKQQKLFANLKIDFESRLIELEELLAAKKQAVTDSEALVEIINKQQSINPEEINRSLANTTNGFLFNEQFKMLDVLFYTGIINDIKNENLKRQLIEWPQKVEEMLEEQRVINGSLIDEYRRLISKYIPLRLINEEFVFRGYAIPKGKPVKQVPNYEGLFGDVEFENLLAERELLLRILILDNEELVKSAKEIIQLLDSEY